MDLGRITIAGSMLCVSLFLGSLRSETANEDHIWLRVDGKNIVTSALANPPNQVFLALGTLVYLDNRDGRFEHAAKFIKKSSMNTVRLMFKATGTDYQTHNANYNFDSTLALIQEWLVIARENKIYTILDNHEYLGHNSASLPTPECFAAWKTNYRKLAEAVKDNPWVIGFELINEVFFRTMTREEVDAELRDCALRIREVNTRHIIFINHHEIDDPAYFDTLNPPQVAISPHAYPSNAGNGDAYPIRWVTGRDAGNYPVLTTEMGGGLGGNGFTYRHNKTWFAQFLNALDERDIGWIATYYSTAFKHNNASTDRNDHQKYFGTLYGPDDPEMWRPVVLSMSEKSPIPSNGIATGIVFDERPVWFGENLVTGEEVELILRVVDATGSMVVGSNASVSVSVSGPATLVNAPSSFTNGKAAATLRTTETPGAITVTATSGSLSGSYVFASAKTWTGFQAQKLDNSWVDSGVVTDNLSPVCRVSINHPSKGINMKTARYEYTTDGGESWVYWDENEGDEFEGSSLDAGKWTVASHNHTGGTATTANGALTLRAAGENVWSTWQDNWYVTNTYAKDEFTYAYQQRDGEFEVVTKILSQDNTSPHALAGIMVRDNMDDTPYKGYCYVAATPDSGYVFAWKDLGRSIVNGADKSTFKYIDARKFAGSVTYPCYLKLSKVKHPGYYDGTATGYNRRFHIYTGWYSTDGVNWTKIFSKWVSEAGEVQLVGPFACSGVSGTHGNSVFDFFRVSLQATHANPVEVSGYGTIVYSNGPEQFVTQAIPFVNSEKRQEVRFRINTVVPFLDYMNNGGEELVSPRYPVFDGENVSVLPVKTDMSALALTAHAAKQAVRIHYTLPRQRVESIRFTAYDCVGRMVWANSVQRPEHGGSVLWEGRTGSGVPAGAYVVRMDARIAGSGKNVTVQSALIHPGQ